ncbi:hypothetical protein ACS0TY_028620 [Phlomoides rotata]
MRRSGRELVLMQFRFGPWRLIFLRNSGVLIGLDIKMVRLLDARVCIPRVVSMIVSGLYAVDVDFGILEALSWIKQLGVERVVIEMDSKLVFDALKGLERVRSVFGGCY